MRSFSRHFSWLYITTLLLATAPSYTPALRSATGPPPEPETRPPAAAATAPVPAPEPPVTAMIPEPAPPPFVPARPAPTEVPVTPAKKSPRELEREREELLKYQEAVRLFREEDRAEQAYGMLDGFLTMHPDSTFADDAVMEQARIRIYQEEPREAVSILKGLLHDYPASHLRKSANLELQRIYYSQEKWRDCIASGANVLSFQPLPDEEVEALTMSAVCRFRKRDRPRAIGRGSRARPRRRLMKKRCRPWNSLPANSRTARSTRSWRDRMEASLTVS